MQFPQDVFAAAELLDGRVRRTPVESSPALAGDSGARVWLKLENLQETGSFKLRGAFHKVLCLDEETRARGVIAASTGNHGAGVAAAAAALGVEATIFAPLTADPTKLAGVRARGAAVKQVGDDCLVAESAAREESAARGLAYVSPYNDPEVVAGQGTLGWELHEQLEGLDAVFIAMGGGGLISGVGNYLKSVRPEIEVIACSPANSCVMHQSLEAGELLDLPSEPTLSDGTAGGVEEGSITFELCRDCVDRSVTVTEEEIAAAMKIVIATHHTCIEGAAGVAAAAFLQDPGRYAGKDVAIVMCGANASLDVLRRVLA